jgi:hypothetical protein
MVLYCSAVARRNVRRDGRGRRRSTEERNRVVVLLHLDGAPRKTRSRSGSVLRGEQSEQAVARGVVQPREGQPGRTEARADLLRLPRDDVGKGLTPCSRLFS